MISRIRFPIRQSRSICVIMGCMLYFTALADWSQLETGIQDNLTGIVFWNESGVLSGEKGIYYTLTGGQVGTAWQRFEITSHPQDAAVYNRSRFNHCNAYQPETTGYVIACGEDTVLHKAVIFRIHLPSLTYDILYTGPTNTVLNHLGFNPENGDYYAVGDQGLIVKGTGSEVSVISSSLFFDLRSITIFNQKYWIGADGYRVWGSDISNFNPTVYPTQDQYADAVFTSNTNAYAVGDFWYQSSNGVTVVPVANFDFGPLHAQAIVREDAYYFVATDHGIYRTTGEASPSVIEWQPTAGSFSYHELWSDPLTNKLYATGNDGLLMITTDYGGKSKPYARMKFLPGACLHTSLQFQGTEFGSATSCKWYVNNTLLRSGCGTFAENFDTTGLYHAELRTDNGTYRDTFAQDFYIVNKPAINLPTLVTDTTICKNQTIEIKLDNTEADVFYTVFRKEGNDEYFFGSSPKGDPGTLTFNSNLISEKGTYYLRGSSSLADCHDDFEIPLPLTIELTAADFRPAAWNVKPGEPVKFHQNANDATSFFWAFSANGHQTNLANPVTTFDENGTGEVQLFVSSDFGCTDMITKPGPTMYVPLDPEDPCWVNHVREVDSPWGGQYDPDISQIRPSKSGYFVCGQFRDISFPTQHGDSVIVEGRGGYLVKYDFDGTVKWFVRSKRMDSGNTSNEFEDIVSVDEDESENVYIAGNLITYGSHFVDNSGLDFKINHRHFIMKLDKFGKMQWYLSGNNIKPSDIAIDHDGNLIVIATSSLSNPVFFKNGQPFDTLMVNPSGNRLLLKISSDGEVIWHTAISIYTNNFSELTEVSVDQDNNIYIVGGCEYRADFYSVGDPMVNRINDWPGLGTMLFLVKYDTAGKYKWGIRSNTMDILIKRVFPLDMVTDDLGNCYISGRNSCKAGGCQFLFENIDSSLTSISAGEYFVAKVNTHGMCEWIQGAAYTFYGFGYGVSLLGDELSVVGEFRDNLNANDVLTAHLTSRNGPGIDLTIGEGDFFIAVYDTTGILLRLYTNGFNKKDYYGDNGKAPGMFQVADGSYYLAKGMEWNAGPYTLFGEQIEPTIDNDGYVVHFDPSCAVVYWPGYNRVDTVYVCAGTSYIFPDGEERIIEMPTIQSSHFTGSGQDTTIITNIRMTEPLVLEVVMNTDTLMAVAQDVSYQWLNCDDDFKAIAGATNQLFAPSATGPYAVELTGLSCIDTSQCVYVVTTGTFGAQPTIPIRYYPNPTSGTVHLDLGEMQDELQFTMTDMTGRIIQRSVLQNVQRMDLVMPEAKGIYMIHLSMHDATYTVIRIIRQ